MFCKAIRFHQCLVGGAITSWVFSVVTYLVLCNATQSAYADIDITGDVEPATASSWGSSTTAYVGKNSYGSVEITGGDSLCSSDGYVGMYSGASGEVTISDSASTWTIGSYFNNWYWIRDGGPLYVGYSGSGTLSVVGGGTLTSGGCEWWDEMGFYTGSSLDSEIGENGVVQVTGGGSTWNNRSSTINIEGTLEILNGGAVSSGGTYSYEGEWFNCSGGNISSTGAVTVDGTNSTWNSSGSIDVEGMLSITDGGGVTCSNSTNTDYIAYSSGSSAQVTVNGDGSVWSSSNSLYIGRNGGGKLTITDGGVVSNKHSCIAYSSSASGEVLVDGNDSVWTNNGNLIVARYGSGLLTIENQGLVTVAGELTIDSDSDGDGFVHMSTGSMLALHGNAGGSLAEFLTLVEGTDAICYWDETADDWILLTPECGYTDYALECPTEGDLTGYTVLTVGVSTIPEPASIVFLVMGLLSLTWLLSARPRG